MSNRSFAWKWALALMLVAAGLGAADVANLSGTWKLNVAKSSWGKKPKPQSVTLQIEHQEPMLRYSGTAVSGTAAEDVHPFRFDGAIDGKEYPAETLYGPGYTSIKRLNSTTILEETRSKNGQFVETTRNTISSDGREMTRRIGLKTPNGHSSWTEVYEKQ